MFSNIKHQISLTIDSDSPVSRVIGITKLAELLKSKGFNIASAVGVDTVKAVNEWENDPELLSAENDAEAFVVTFTEPQPTFPVMQQQPFGYPQGGYPNGQRIAFCGGPGSGPMFRGWGNGWPNRSPVYPVGGFPQDQVGAVAGGYQHTGPVGLEITEAQFIEQMYQIYCLQGYTAAERFASANGMTPIKIAEQLNRWEGARVNQRWGQSAARDPRKTVEPAAGKETPAAATGLYDVATGRSLDPKTPGNIQGYEHNPMAQKEYFAGLVPSVGDGGHVLTNAWPIPLATGMLMTSQVHTEDSVAPGCAHHEYSIQMRGYPRAHWTERTAKIKFQKGPIDPEEGQNGVRVEELLAICADHLQALQVEAAGAASRPGYEALKSIQKALQSLHGEAVDKHLRIGQEPTAADPA